MKNKKLAQTSSNLLRYTSLGLEMGVATAIGLFIGMALDRYFDTSPWLTAIFIVLGMAAGFKNVIKLALEESKKDEFDEKND